MHPQPIQRKLAAVLIADVVAYSKMMEQDEDGTHRRMHEIREQSEEQFNLRREELERKHAEQLGQLRAKLSQKSGSESKLQSEMQAFKSRCDVLLDRQSRQFYCTNLTARWDRIGRVLVRPPDASRDDPLNMAAAKDSACRPGPVSTVTAPVSSPTSCSSRLNQLLGQRMGNGHKAR